jgi:hypothetical protein
MAVGDRDEVMARSRELRRELLEMAAKLDAYVTALQAAVEQRLSDTEGRHTDGS